AEQVMKFTTERTIMLILVVNVTAALGAFAFGYLQDAIGHVRAIALTLVGWIAMVVIAASSHSVFSFWVAANLAGLCMGSSQAAGRALVGYLAPPSRVAEFFGLWGLSVKAASIFGPLTYGAVAWSFGGDHRLAILATGAYFVIGLALPAGSGVIRTTTSSVKPNQKVVAVASIRPSFGCASTMSQPIAWAAASARAKAASVPAARTAGWMSG